MEQNQAPQSKQAGEINEKKNDGFVNNREENEYNPPIEETNSGFRQIKGKRKSENYLSSDREKVSKITRKRRTINSTESQASISNELRSSDNT